LIKKVSGRGNKNPEFDYAGDPVEGAEVPPSCSEDAQCRSIGRIPPCLDIEFLSEAPKILRFVIDDRKHSAEENQVAGLQRLNVGAERRRGRGESYAQVLQSAFCPAEL
jgi:hypothetical protein